MKRPWQYWTVYVVTLALVLTAMTWLTFMALELDQAEIAARRQAELEEDINRALWRMEVKLMPILAKEAARPSAAYQPILSGQELLARPLDQQTPGSPVKLSPLLTDRSNYVLLNFEVGPTNAWSSPQSLSGSLCVLACDNGASLEDIEQCTQRLDELKETVQYNSLFESLPEETFLARRTADGPADPTGSQPQSLSPSNNNVDFNPLQQMALQGAAPNPDAEMQSQQVANSYGSRRSRNRSRNDLNQRAAALLNYAQSTDSEIQANSPTIDAVREGVSRPVWVGTQLLFARRVESGDAVRIQGCVLNWQKIKQQLLDEVQDLLPQVDIEPVFELEQVNVSRMLAALPAQLVVAPLETPPIDWSPMRVSLLIVWICLLVSFVGAGVVLHGVLLLSERRGAFVSAVTHELRTPLTTFRMYSEMLAGDMVPDPARRHTYLETLRREADRLSHLVENVLSYARLERGPIGRGRERLAVAELLERMHARLAERADQAEMQCVLEIDKSARQAIVETDPAAVEQILFNLVDNACKYAVSAEDRRIHLEVTSNGDNLRLSVRDHGLGIAARQVRKLFRPFSKAVNDAPDTTPGVGLGLALCRRLARELGGRLEFDSDQPCGATFTLDLPAERID